MFFQAPLLAFAPLLLFILAVCAQNSEGPYIIVNTATGLVFEDRRNFPLEVGNPIVGAQYDATRFLAQAWSLQLAPGFSFFVRNDRLVGFQTVYARANGSEQGGPQELVTTETPSTFFFWQQVFPVPWIGALLVGPFSSIAITAPKVANGTLTLEPYDAANQYQHWLLVPVPGPRSTGAGGLPASVQPVAKPLLGKEKGAAED